MLSLQDSMIMSLSLTLLHSERPKLCSECNRAKHEVLLGQKYKLANTNSGGDPG